MTSHDRQLAPEDYEPIWKESEEWLNRNVKVDLKPGVYICKDAVSIFVFILMGHYR